MLPRIENPVRKPIQHLTVGHLKSCIVAISGGAFKLTFSALLVAAALGATYIGSESNFPEIELRDVLARGMAVSGILLLGALAISLRSRAVGNGVLALITLGGIFTAYVVHTELFHPENRAWLIGMCSASLFALFTAFRIIDDFRWGGLALSVAASLPVAALIWRKAGPELTAGLNTPGGLLYIGSTAMWLVLIGICVCSVLALYMMSLVVHPSRWGGIAILSVALAVVALFVFLGHKYGSGGAVGYGGVEARNDYYDSGWEDHPNVRPIALEETPNLYFVGFDAITPEAIMQKYMGIQATDFHRVVNEDMRRFRNLFASSVSTRHSLNTLLALDLDLYLNHRLETGSLPNYFAGHDLSLLVWLLRQNGYETTSIFENAFLGNRGGPGIDNYIIRQDIALCSLLDRSIRTWAFWGYCWNQESTSFRPSQVLSRDDFFVLELTEIKGSRPQFIIAHILLPSHTPLKTFDFSNQVQKDAFFPYYEERFYAAAIVLQQIIELLRANDPNAILFVFGDHGAWLSNGMELEDDPEFFLQDRFGILGGVYPPHRCASELDEAESKGYMTSLDVVHAILLCLSGGQSPLIEPRRDRFWGSGMPEDHSYDYKEFLYE